MSTSQRSCHLRSRRFARLKAGPGQIASEIDLPHPDGVVFGLSSFVRTAPPAIHKVFSLIAFGWKSVQGLGWSGDRGLRSPTVAKQQACALGVQIGPLSPDKDIISEKMNQQVPYGIPLTNNLDYPPISDCLVW